MWQRTNDLTCTTTLAYSLTYALTHSQSMSIIHLLLHCVLFYQQVFDECIALASNKSTGREYNQGIFYNKRLNFFVFRTIVFTTLATRTGYSSDELFVKLTSGLPEVRTCVCVCALSPCSL